MADRLRALFVIALQASIAYRAGMKKKARYQGRSPGQQRRVQYTVRDVSPAVDSALRRKARAQGKSMSSLLREALEREAGLTGGGDVVHHDLDRLAGLWETDPDFDAAVAAQDTVDEDLWR